jgi:hypothetical protein
MKYIKLFENFKSKDILEQFCKDNLAYLIDAGYIFQIVDDDIKEYIMKQKYESENLKQICILNKNGLSFDIQDIIYDIIPFLIELNNKYELHAYSDNLDSDEKVYISYHYNKDTNPYSDECISISELDSIKEHRKVEFIEVLVENVI